MAQKLSSAFGGSGPAVAGAAGVAAVAVAGAVAWAVLRDDAPDLVAPEIETTTTAPMIDDVTVAEPPAPEVADQPAPEATDQPAPEVADTAPEPPAPMAPRFDLVRVEADGSAVIAGQAEALATVTVRLDGDPVEVTRADGGGNFVVLLALDPSDDARLLSLEAALDGGDVVAGTETVIIAPFAGPAEPPAALAEAVTDPVAAAPEAEADLSEAPPVADTAAEPPATDNLADAGGEITPEAVAAAPEETPAAPTDPAEALVATEVVTAAPDAAPSTPPAPPPETEVARPGFATLTPAPEVAADPDAAPETEAVAALDLPATEPVPAPITAPLQEAVATPAQDTNPAPDPVAAATAEADPQAPEAAAPAEAAPDIAAADTALQPVDETPQAPEPPAPDTTAPETPAPQPEPTPEVVPTPEAPTVLIASDEGVRVLQGAGPVPRAQTAVRLDAISYDIDGDVTLAGRGPAEADIRVLLNNQPIQLGEVGPGGDWSLQLPQVDPGTYTLTVEQLNAEGRVASRVDTPFLREDPARIAASPMLVEAGASVITVQPGFTLWGIAQTNFGDGVLYVSIFEENRDQIRNPDLIFPGQIFSLPDLPRVTPGE